MSTPTAPAPTPPLPSLRERMSRLVARQRVNAAVERLQLLLADPQHTRPATAGELAEYRHLLDPALDYTHQETT